MKKTIRLSKLAMAATILVLVLFQSWWLLKNYKDEKRDLHFRSYRTFRESIWEMQAIKLKLDTNTRFRYPRRGDIANMLRVIRGKIKDSSLPKEMDSSKLTAIFKTKGLETITTSGVRVDLRSKDGNFFEAIMGSDALQDTITTQEIGKKLKENLKEANISIDFFITISDTVNNEDGPPSIDRNEATVGFTHPVTYKLTLQNETFYLLKKLAPQIAFSFFLIGITLFSFLLLYKNLLRQRRLTELKSDFINNITHELKTPIATVSVAIEAMKNFNALQNPERTKEYLEISGNELNRLGMLVDKVLKLSMFERKQLEMNKENLNLMSLVEGVTKSMQLQFEKQQAVVTTKYEGTNFSINGDRLHITSVVYNLLDNALKYSSSQVAIQIGITETQTHLALSVSDNGMGINEAYKHKIFEKFFRVPHGDTHNIKGYGLGLSYVAQVLKEHNAHIQVDSAEGKGTTFIITFQRQNG